MSHALLLTGIWEDKYVSLEHAWAGYFMFFVIGIAIGMAIAQWWRE